MKLPDKKYYELMKNKNVADAAKVLKKHMLDRSNTGSKVQREIIDNEKRELIEAIEIIKKIQNNTLLTIYLNIHENKLRGTLKYLQFFKKQKEEGKRKRIEKYFYINTWIGMLIIELYSAGLIATVRREDFIFKLISENNLDNYKFTEKSQDDEAYQIHYTYKMNEQSIRRMIRKIDKKCRYVF